MGRVGSGVACTRGRPDALLSMSTSRPPWRNGASLLALAAGVLSAAVLVIEGPPGSGYGWGSVATSAAILGILFVIMAWTVASGARGQAMVCGLVAVVVVLMFTMSLVGNWAMSPTRTRVLDVLSFALALSASAVAFWHAITTLRAPRAPHPSAPSR